MTQNQINYWNLQELKRHNVVGEGETNRHNLVTERETGRHNLATENIDISKLAETSRHNRAGEKIEAGKLSESARHNLVSEGQNQQQLGINLGNLSELSRHNKAGEYLQGIDLSILGDRLTEETRHHMNQESIDRYNADTSRLVGEAQAALNQVRSTWEGLQSSSNIGLNDARVRQINRELDLLEQQITNARNQNQVFYANNFFNNLNSVSNSVRNVGQILSER